MDEASACSLLLFTPSKGIFLFVKFHNAENLYSTFKMCRLNRGIIDFRYEYFQGILQGPFKLLEVVKTSYKIIMRRERRDRRERRNRRDRRDRREEQKKKKKKKKMG